MKKLPITCLAGILAVSAVSCGQNKEKEDNSYNDSIANVLVQQASKLMNEDISFLRRKVNVNDPTVSVNDSLIMQKLDSAKMLSPESGKPYITRYTYLIHCGKLAEALQALDDMDKQSKEPMAADLRSSKGILEDYLGNSEQAQIDFRKADEAYQKQLDTTKTDTHLYGALQIGRALNRSLKEDKFTYLTQAADEFQAVQKRPLIGAQLFKFFKSKSEYYKFLFEGDSTLLKKLQLNKTIQIKQ